MLFYVLARPSELCKCIVVIERGGLPLSSKSKMSFAHSPSRPDGEPCVAAGGRGPRWRSGCCRRWGLCSLGEPRCSQWPRCPGHTQSIPGAPAGRPRIAGIPREGPSSPASQSSVSAGFWANSLVCALHTCQDLVGTHTDRGRGGRSGQSQPSAPRGHSWRGACLFSSRAVGRMAFDCPWLQGLGSARSCWEEALRLPFSLRLEPGGRARRVALYHAHRGPRPSSRHSHLNQRLYWRI